MIVPDYMDLADLQREFPAVFERTRYADAGVGWRPTVIKFVTDAQRAWADLTVDSLGQKWGVLDIRLAQIPAYAADEVALAIALAEMRSMHRCEVCGLAGFIRQPALGSRMYEWICCRCDEHATERQRSWPRPAMYDRREIHIGGANYRYIVDDDCLEMADPSISLPPTERRYPR